MTEPWAWLDLVGGAFRTWARSEARPTSTALRVDGRLAEPGGPATWASWCRFDGDASLAFDDGAVTGALRRRLALPSWPVAVSTALVDWSRIAGALTLATDERDLRDDPFARVFPQTVVRIPPGSLGVVPAPTGPGVTRYGSGNPWPWAVYRGQVA